MMSRYPRISTEGVFAVLAGMIITVGCLIFAVVLLTWPSPDACQEIMADGFFNIAAGQTAGETVYRVSPEELTCLQEEFDAIR